MASQNVGCLLALFVLLILILSNNSFTERHYLACEQALRGTLAAGREKEGELATTSLEFEYCIEKVNACKVLIGGDDISNDIITLCTCFSALVSHLFQLCGDWQKSDR